MKPLRVIEVAAWTAGILMLGAYASARTWYSVSSESSVAAFETARTAHQRIRIAENASGARRTLSTDEAVDVSKWSPKRIAEYREALKEKRVPIAVLRMPALDLVVPVFDGTSDANLNRGAGRIEGTAAIGARGNLGIAAHRDGFFRSLKDVREGDVLLLDALDGTVEYRVVGTGIVDPSNVRVLDATTVQSITLVTCYPFYFAGSAPQRFIVRAQIVQKPEVQTTGSTF